MLVSLLISADDEVEPEVVKTHGRQENVRVVGLVVMGDPGSSESPEALDEWIAAESSGLLLLSTCNNVS